MQMFNTAIEKSREREADLSNEIIEARMKHDEEITQLHTRLDASEKIRHERLEQLAQWEEWEWTRAAAAPVQLPITVEHHPMNSD
eukprot:11220701-Lingulodinium_polyedra.AAC.1